MTTSRRPIVAAVAIAIVTTVAIWLLVRVGSEEDRVRVGEPAPPIVATTLEGEPFDLADLRGRPVVVNFWGPSCVPCREEMPLLADKAEQHADDGFAIVGVLMNDPVEPAIAFEDQYGSTWPTVEDPDGAIKTAYRVVARPTSYFVDAEGIVRSIQQGYLTDVDFERQYASIAPSSASSTAP